MSDLRNQTGRFLSDRLKKFLDEQLSPSIVNPLSCVLEAAEACVGIMEEGGDNRGPLVEAFQATIGDVQRESWCLAFIQSLFAYTEDRFGVAFNVYPTEHCMTLWTKTPNDFRYIGTEPQIGDIVLWQYGDTQKGHCGIVMKNAYKVIETIEGNTSPGGNEEREGDCVAHKLEGKAGTIHRQIVGYVRPSFKQIVSVAK